MDVFAMDTLSRESHLGMHRLLHRPIAPVTQRASRCLFGVADPQDTRAAFERTILEEYKRCIEKWDFDPMAGKPVENPKRYLWEEILPPPRLAREVDDGGRPDRPSLPVDAAPLPGKESGDGGRRRGERSERSAVDGSFPAREDAHRWCASPRSAAVRGGDEVGRSREASRFEPYGQHRITDFWRQRKPCGEAKSSPSSGASATGGEGRTADDRRVGGGDSAPPNDPRPLSPTRSDLPRGQRRATTAPGGSESGGRGGIQRGPIGRLSLRTPPDFLGRE